MASVARYSRTAVVIHWLMAAAIIAMLGMGFVMTGLFGEEAVEPMRRFQLYQWHKSLGVILLWLIALRLAWRLTHRPPEATRIYPKWERMAAMAGHFSLYVLMILMPLTGWLIVSSSPTGLPTIVFGWFQWPHLPGLEAGGAAHDVGESLHYWLAWLLVAMIAGHIGAVVKHWVIDRENILPRMWFGRRRVEKIDA